ncbi:DUF885 domain-containing protein [Neoactinobaculum massilliense]|uniref:DUF885 domain-containing protein n=1 Tax=Neoactinobaculum massilliense TaxID=2364794 RepID=UPI000F54A945|nr:DUF885 domain-containing protein [Neoactinobaculum massilliense]
MYNTRPFTKLDAIAEAYFSQTLALSPEAVTATGLGTADQATLDDYSPEGNAARLDVARRTLAELAGQEPEDLQDRVTLAGLRERLGLDVEMAEAGESTAPLNVIESPAQSIRDIFDSMPQDSAADWELIARRLGAVRGAVDGYITSLRERLTTGPAFPLRQVERVAEQADVAAGEHGAFASLVHRGARLAPHPDLLERNAGAAREAYANLGRVLREEIAPHATEQDGVGEERYALYSREFLGTEVNFRDTYEWARAELARIDAEQQAIARELYGEGVGVGEALSRLDAEARYQLHGVDALRDWLQRSADEALAAVRPYFDVPEPMARIQAMIAPSNSGGIYYTGPTDDFSRPGRIWWSVPDGVDTFSTWQERTTVYHEGVPGHHMQLGFTTFLRGELNAWRRQGYWVSGHGEGWALYAEQLMSELGFQDDPGNRMGVLDSERLRTARIIVDMGVHLGFSAGAWADDDGAGFSGIGAGGAQARPGAADVPAASAPGPAWDHDSAWRFLRANVAMNPSFLTFELDRYLGWPAQASSYKIGQHTWLELREEARRSAVARGESFDLKDWHMKALRLGGVGLDILKKALQ